MEHRGPPPVRSLYNSVEEQQLADAGTLLATRSIEIIALVLKSQRKRRVPNPPGSDSQEEGPAWRLPEMQAFIEAQTAIFNTCSFQSNLRTRWYKPGRFSGRLLGLEKLANLARSVPRTLQPQLNTPRSSVRSMPSSSWWHSSIPCSWSSGDA